MQNQYQSNLKIYHVKLVIKIINIIVSSYLLIDYFINIGK